MKLDKKPIEIGFVTILDEEEMIRGWAKTMCYFCDRVVVLIDPINKDDTVKILEDEFPQIEIQWQDRSLGDSTYWEPGPKRECINHANQNAFMETIPNGTWVMMLAADERFDPNLFRTLAREIKLTKRLGHDGIVHKQFYEFLYDEVHFTAYKPGDISKVRFFKKTNEWYKPVGAHTNIKWFPVPHLQSGAALFHFPTAKIDQRLKCWHYTEFGDYNRMRAKHGGRIPTRIYESRLFDLKDLHEISMEEL